MFESEQIAMLRAAGRAVPDRSVTFSGIRAYVEQHVVLDTTLGEIELKMRPDAAPNTVFNFMHLVEGEFYTDIIFHRIVPRARDGSPFVIQVGDPTGGGEGGPGYAVDLERSTLPHGFGVISMARSGDPDSNGSQVFICLSRAGTARLDGLYTAFGQSVRGGDVIQAIAATPVNEQGRAVDPPVLRSARLVPAPPIGKGPEPLGEPTSAPTER
ncbi:MAG: peptidylprolyl isomerase [Leptolyngbya sp. PLA3]|nr:MAG: peptidylprolyl isomerase [Cyanobacteria bacterium CYA]MCE7967829.1 peptidylprolyl isomerase [Leptolyngbya sp. PL-A3]